MLDFFFFFFFLTLNPTTTTTTALRFSLLFIAITSVSLLFQITTRRLFAFILLHLSVVLYASLPESWQFPLLRTNTSHCITPQLEQLYLPTGTYLAGP